MGGWGLWELRVTEGVNEVIDFFGLELMLTEDRQYFFGRGKVLTISGTYCLYSRIVVTNYSLYDCWG